MGKIVSTEMSKIQVDVAVTKEKISSIEASIRSINKAISGNGQPGLIQNLAANEEKLDKHIIEDNTWKGNKDGAIMGLKWAISIGFTIISLVIAFTSFI